MTTINEISNHIMGYFDGTLDAFGYTAQSVNEISNPDESYMGTLNLQFREYPIDDDEKVETYCRESDAFEQVSRGKPMENLSLTCKYNASLLAHRELPIILYSISTGIHIHNR